MSLAVQHGEIADREPKRARLHRSGATLGDE
jgi:hypothetical protein